MNCYIRLKKIHDSPLMFLLLGATKQMLMISSVSFVATKHSMNEHSQYELGGFRSISPESQCLQPSVQLSLYTTKTKKLILLFTHKEVFDVYITKF